MKLNLPEFEVKLKKSGDKIFIFDIIRKKNILLTPEEWVRQHFIHYMIDHLGYPKGLINVENKLSYHTKTKRTDIQVYNRNGNLFMIVECKAPYIAINQAVFDQIAQYNKILKAPFIVLTNGLETQCYEIDTILQKVTLLDTLPLYSI